MKYIAFLRGINVGGNKVVPMDQLASLLKRLKLTDIKTVLNSGNIIFETPVRSIEKIESKIQNAILKEFGFSVLTQIRLFDNMQEIFKGNHFGDLPYTETTSFYISFCSSLPSIQDKEEQMLPESLTTILLKGEILSVVDTEKCSTIELMKFLEKTYGKEVTTRTWKTLGRIIRAGI